MKKYLPNGTDPQAGIQKEARKKSKLAQPYEETITNSSANASSTTTTKLPGFTLPTEARTAGGDNNETIPETPEQRKARKKALKALRAAPAESTALSPTEPTKKGKKRKHKIEDIEDKEVAGSTSAPPGTVEGPPKKKHKNRTEFADPREDTNLNNQSRKALEYAFIQMNRPSKWKFNKARQNWLIRNFWAPEALPDVYFPLAVKYLAGVQGGSREKLAQTCQSYLKSEESTEKDGDEKNSTPTNLPAASIAPRSILKPTPGPLIDLLPSSRSLDAANASTSTPIPSTVPAATVTDIKRARAQVLLDTLGSSNDT